MTILRGDPDRYVKLPNKAIDDPQLDLDALAVLAFQLSRAPDWKTRLKHLAGPDRKIGRERAQKIMRRLIQCGYAARLRQVHQGQRYGAVVYVIAGNPDDLKAYLENLPDNMVAETEQPGKQPAEPQRSEKQPAEVPERAVSQRAEKQPAYLSTESYERTDYIKRESTRQPGKQPADTQRPHGTDAGVNGRARPKAGKRTKPPTRAPAPSAILLGGAYDLVASALSDADFRSWFAEVRAVPAGNGWKFYAPTTFIAERIRRDFVDKIEALLPGATVKVFAETRR